MRSGESVDIWEVDGRGFPIEDRPDGWLICPAEIPSDRVVLFTADAKVGPESGVPGVRVAWNGGRGSNWFKADTADDARECFIREVAELTEEGMGDVVVERWEGARVVDRMELDGDNRYPSPITFEVTWREDRVE
jgi:hypothetical protein